MSSEEQHSYFVPDWGGETSASEETTREVVVSLSPERSGCISETPPAEESAQPGGLPKRPRTSAAPKRIRRGSRRSRRRPHETGEGLEGHRTDEFEPHVKSSSYAATAQSTCDAAGLQSQSLSHIKAASEEKD